MKKLPTAIMILALLTLLGMPGFGAHDNPYELDAYTVVHPTGDPNLDAMNLRQAIDGGGPVLLQSQDQEGNQQHFNIGVLHRLKKECTLYLENPDDAMSVLGVRAKDLKSLVELEERSILDSKPSKTPSATQVNAIQLNIATILEGTAWLSSRTLWISYTPAHSEPRVEHRYRLRLPS